MPPKQKPFLGVRAIRLLRRFPHLFDAQIRAIIQVGQSYPIQLMFPMIATMEDWRTCQDLVHRILAEGSRSWKPIPLGCMVEIPSAVWIADELAQHVNFFSIGTNDLIQYLFAADRLSPDLTDYYRPLDPTVLHSIQRVADAGHRHHISVSVCGEMASDVPSVAPLLGLGIDTLSVAPQRIPAIKQQVTSLSLSQCRETVQQLLSS